MRQKRIEMPDQRAIKFRLIYKGKIVGYEHHGLFNLEKVMNITHRHITGEMAAIDKRPDVYIKHDHKDQFTGMLDMDRNGIYEGDIVELDAHYEGDYWEKKKKHEVIFDEGGFWFGCEPFQVSSGNIKAKIIGNIWENREKQEDQDE